MHLLRRAFEQASATGGKQGVTAEQQAVMVIGDMPQGVAGDGKDIEVPAQHADAVVVLEGHVPQRDGFAGWTVDCRVCRFFELLDAADVVMMMMSDQNITQHPTRMRGEPGLHWRGIARIDHGAALGAVVL